jgi:hypothetical protein
MLTLSVFADQKRRTHRISLDKAIGLISRYRRLQIITQTPVHDVKKTGLPANLRETTVVKRRQVTLNVPYADEVNRRRTLEGLAAQFKAKDRLWGNRVALPFVLHYRNDGGLQLYVSMHIEQDLHVQYFDGLGYPIPANEIQPWLRTRSSAQRQHLEEPVIYRDILLTNIQALILPDRKAIYVLDSRKRSS